MPSALVDPCQMNAHRVRMCSLLLGVTMSVGVSLSFVDLTNVAYWEIIVIYA